jgi:hypothetical protein
VKSLWLRGISGSLEQYFEECEPDRIFVSYDEIVGPQRYMKAYNGPDGADFSFQFPVRRYFDEKLLVQLPDGTTVERTPHLAAKTRSGLIDTWDKPQGRDYRADRVYLLDCGVTIRGWHIVDLPPDPAGSEGRIQDGVHIYKLPHGGRFEVTYRGGLPHGKFRAFRADGSRWGEANYDRGRLVGPSWIYRADGSRYNELDPAQRPH